MWAIDNGYNDVTVKDVLPTVEAEIRKEISELMSALPEQMMEQYIGQKNIDRLRKQRISKVKNVPKTANSIKQQASAPVKKKEAEVVKPKKSIEDFLRSR